MKESPTEVITVNFNHEMVDKPEVFSLLTRQLTRQLGPVLNSAYRDTKGRWPLLVDMVTSGKRLVVFYSWDVTKPPFNQR